MCDVLTIVDAFAPTPMELIKRYRARKIDERYVINAIELPWVIKREIDVEIIPGRSYVVSGVTVTGLTPPWEVYVTLIDEGEEFGVGYIVARRRRMFNCISKSYAKPIDVQIAQYIIVKPVDLLLTDKEGEISCVDKAFRAKHLAVLFNMPHTFIQQIQMSIDPVVTFK